MSWREAFINRCRPSLLTGISVGDWVKLLRANRIGIAPRYLIRVAAIAGSSLQNSVLRRCEGWRFGPKIKNVAIHPPLFILGHWRSGTTLLHNLFCLDERFAFPNLYQVAFPHTFLSTEAALGRALGCLLPGTRPMDSVAETAASPAEDERALCALTLRSPYMGYVFPSRHEEFDRYLTFRGVSEVELGHWRACMHLFLRKLTWKYDRSLVLKSPPHTARIRLLVEMFPEARFVHVHRDPYAVFQSTRRHVEMAVKLYALQSSHIDLDEWVIRRYTRMYDAFFEERRLVARGRFYDVRFEELEQDPITVIRDAYHVLGLPDFSVVVRSVRRHVESLKGYKKNTFPELEGGLRKRLAFEWRREFKEWGYAMKLEPCGME